MHKQMLMLIFQQTCNQMYTLETWKVYVLIFLTESIRLSNRLLFLLLAAYIY